MAANGLSIKAVALKAELSSNGVLSMWLGRARNVLSHWKVVETDAKIAAYLESFSTSARASINA